MILHVLKQIVLSLLLCLELLVFVQRHIKCTNNPQMVLIYRQFTIKSSTSSQVFQLVIIQGRVTLILTYVIDFIQECKQRLILKQLLYLLFKLLFLFSLSSFDLHVWRNSLDLVLSNVKFLTKHIFKVFWIFGSLGHRFIKCSYSSSYVYLIHLIFKFGC